METVLAGNKTDERVVTLKLTERDLFLLKWSLDLMARSYIEGGTLRLEIDGLRSKLTMKRSS